MKDLFLVAKFTFKDLVRRKSFIVSNIIILLIIVVGFNIPGIIKNVSGNNTESGKSVITIVDNENVFEDALNPLIAENDNDNDYKFILSSEKLNIDEIKEKINKDEMQDVLYISKGENSIDVKYIIKSAGLTTEIPQDLIAVLQSKYQTMQITKLGIGPEKLKIINEPFNVEILQADNNKAGNNIFPMMLLSMVLFYAIYFFAYQVSASITVEKTSKIIETLVTSTSPKTIVLGKTLGIGFAGVLQTIVTVTFALICAKAFLDPNLINAVLQSINLSPEVAVITIGYYILGYALFALLYALTGSTVGKPEDVQSANGPVAILAVIGFYLSYFTMMNPTSTLNQIAAIVPISSPFCMPFRVMMGLNTTSDLFISLGVLLLTILIVARVSVKIYSSAILNNGSKLNIKELSKMYKNDK